MHRLAMNQLNGTSNPTPAIEQAPEKDSKWRIRHCHRTEFWIVEKKVMLFYLIPVWVKVDAGFDEMEAIEMVARYKAEGLSSVKHY